MLDPRGLNCYFISTIDIQHSQCPCRCLLKRLGLFVVTIYETEVHIVHATQQGDLSMQTAIEHAGEEKDARQHTRPIATKKKEKNDIIRKKKIVKNRVYIDWKRQEQEGTGSMENNARQPASILAAIGASQPTSGAATMLGFELPCCRSRSSKWRNILPRVWYHMVLGTSFLFHTHSCCCRQPSYFDSMTVLFVKEE